MKNITLEMSLKPFKKNELSYIQQVCKTMFTQWRPLLCQAECVSIMLWVGSGGELLDYRGNLEDTFDWGQYAGVADRRPEREFENQKLLDPDGIGLHSRNYLYMENPPVFSYGDLRQILLSLRHAANEMLGENVRVRIGATMDPGPEFSKSDFKYDRHNEICMGAGVVGGAAPFICSYARLHGDNVAYASYPNGIPEGEPFGTFLGKQTQAYLTDMGFDYIWLSNGLGFGRDVWSTVGAVFDGEQFHEDQMKPVQKAVLEFWNLFRAACPDYPIEVRGTNMTMGIDMSTDGVPLKAIYDADLNILPPPNSPWAALNGDYGLELAGYMSRVAKLPKENKYLYRYYIHDTWWANSPWLDRYNRQPHDIYMPLGVATMDANGEILPPSNLNVFTVDNTLGEMPDFCVNEVIPHLNRAIQEMPDAPAPFVWVYPFDEYSNCDSQFKAKRMFAEDWFVRGAINNGLPLSMVVSTDHFMAIDSVRFASSILVTPVPDAGSSFEQKIMKYAKTGGKVIFYGNVAAASQEFLKMVGLRLCEAEESGVLPVSVNGINRGKMRCNPIVCAGGINTVENGETEVLETTGNGVTATCGKSFVWVRGLVSADYIPGQQLLVPHDSRENYIAESVILEAARRLGYGFEFACEDGTRTPISVLHRSNNAYMFSLFSPSTTVKTKLKFPLGAPILDGYETRLEDGYATYHFPKAEHRECRVFVEQKDGIVGVRELPPVNAQYRRRIEVVGLKDATVRLLPENDCKENMQVLLNTDVDWCFVGEPFDGGVRQIGADTVFEIKHATGHIVFSMPYPEKRFF